MSWLVERNGNRAVHVPVKERPRSAWASSGTPETIDKNPAAMADNYARAHRPYEFPPSVGRNRTQLVPSLGRAELEQQARLIGIIFVVQHVQDGLTVDGKQLPARQDPSVQTRDGIDAFYHVFQTAPLPRRM